MLSINFIEGRIKLLTVTALFESSFGHGRMISGRHMIPSEFELRTNRIVRKMGTKK